MIKSMTFLRLFWMNFRVISGGISGVFGGGLGG